MEGFSANFALNCLADLLTCIGLVKWGIQMKRGKIALLTAVAILIVLVVFIGYKKRTGLVIGVVLPLSGSMAEYGQNAQNGLIMARDELQGQKGLGNLKLLIQDSKEVPSDTELAVKRLIEVERVQYVIGGLTSSGVLAAKAIPKEKGVLFFTPAASAPGIPDGELIFRNWPSDDSIANAYGSVAYTKLGARNVAILHVSNDYGKTNATAFSESFKLAGGNISSDRAFPQGAVDFKTLITHLTSLKEIDTIFLVAYPDEYKGLFQEIAIARLNEKRILTSDTFYSPSLIAELGDSTEGVLCATASKPGKDYNPRKIFTENYKKRFNKDPGLVSDTAYDALHMIGKAISETDGSPKSVAQWLRQLAGYQGAAGLVTFTPDGDVKGELSLYEVKQGKFEPRSF